MQGDFSRTTFDPADGYRSVLLQQGRVLLDADWNEQAEITAHHDEVRTRDVVGRSGGPAPAAGATGPAALGPFAIVAADGSAPAATPWADLRVTPGRYYVDGVLAESSPPGGGGGWPLADQPHLRAIGAGADAVPGLAEPDAAEEDRFAVYLDVFTHHVTADEDPALLEPALGGPDTTTRERTVWQVRLRRLEDGDLCSDLHAPGRFARTPRRMRAALHPAETPADPCRIGSDGGYERLENQLYRVQVHEGGDAPTFLWSRDNGSVVAGLLSLTPDDDEPDLLAVLGLDRIGRDEELSFREGQLLEVTSADRELRGLPGFLATAGAPVGLTLPVTWSGARPASRAALGSAPVVRRWDGGPHPVREASTDLEDGIGVTFSAAGRADTGDYWTVPARTVRSAFGLTQLSGSIQWPPGGKGPLERVPEGVLHRGAPLAILVREAGGWTRESDCRVLFPPLGSMVTLDLVGGDGQEAMPGDPLPEPVRVAVRNGGLPVAGARVLAVTTAGGHLAAAGTPPGAAPAVLPLVTDADGVASVRWLLDGTGATTQTLRLWRLTDRDERVDVPVAVTGRLSVAREVAWEPPCEGFADTRTVQDALARLATTRELRLLGGDGQAVAASGATVPQAVRVIVDSPCGPAESVKVIARTGDSAALVAPAVPGDPTPPTLEGTGAGSEVTLPADAAGEAYFWWQPAFGEGRSASLVIVAPDTGRVPVVVHAHLDAGGGRTPGMHVVRTLFGSGRVFANDSEVGAVDLVTGIRAVLDRRPLKESVNGKPVVRVVLDLPWPLGAEGEPWGLGRPIGTRPITIGFGAVEDDAVVWQPGDDTRGWLLDSLWGALLQFGLDLSVEGRFEIDGWAVIDAEDAENPEGPVRHLNGHATAVTRNGRTRLDLPTDDEVTGGQFVQWFRLQRTVDAQQVRVPDVTRQREATARRDIEAAGLLVSEVVREGTLEMPPGLVLRTEPEAGAQLARGSSVAVVLSRRQPL